MTIPMSSTAGMKMKCAADILPDQSPRAPGIDAPADLGHLALDLPSRGQSDQT